MDAFQQPDGVPVLQVNGVSKRFGGIRAVEEVSFNLSPAQVVAIVGENGAGKSTLIGLISGDHAPDEGSVLLEGKPIGRRSHKQIRELGIETVYQDLALADNFNAAANIYLGREPRRFALFGMFDRATIEREATSTLVRLGFSLPDPRRLVRSLSGGQRQGVAIARALHWPGKVFILDEPTAAVGVEGRRRIRSLIGELRADGRAIIYVTPNAREALEVATRVVVLRRGRRVADKSADQVTVDEVVGYMLGARSDG